MFLFRKIIKQDRNHTDYRGDNTEPGNASERGLHDLGIFQSNIDIIAEAHTAKGHENRHQRAGEKAEERHDKVI